MAKNTNLRGCHRRVLRFLIVIVAVILAIGFFLFQRVGGATGSRYWMAERALNSVERHLLQHRPDGIAQPDVKHQFERIRSANTQRRVDLLKLYAVLKDYQDEFQKIKPSTPEVVLFLENLRSAIASDTNK